METPQSIFCRNVYYLRKKHHLTQKEMAQILGVGVGNLRKMEKGPEYPRIYGKMLIRVCNHFDIFADVMLKEDIWENARSSARSPVLDVCGSSEI